MTVKSILALPLGADTHESTMACALMVARQFGAHIAVTHVKGLVQLLAAGAFDAYSGYISEDLMIEFEAKEEERQTQMRAAFERFVTREGLAVRTSPEFIDEVTAGWNTIDGHAGDVVARQGGGYDLIVVGRPEDGAASSSRAIVESALFATGRPVLIAPPEPPATIGEKVLIGWNRSPPAARAFHAAKALLLERAQQVRIMSVATGAKSGPSAEEIADNLAWHGIAAEVREIAPDYRSVGEVVLAEAGAIGADLVVMGAYSHSRIRQMILGGVTQHVFTHATLPVFMAH